MKWESKNIEKAAFHRMVFSYFVAQIFFSMSTVSDWQLHCLVVVLTTMGIFLYTGIIVMRCSFVLFLGIDSTHW